MLDQGYRLYQKGNRWIYEDPFEGRRAVLPEGVEARLLQPKPLEAVCRSAKALLERPDSGLPFPELIRKRQVKTVSILVSDATRHVPTKQVLPQLIAYLNAAGVADSNIRLVVALGVHRPAVEAEIEAILGGELSGKRERLSIRNHDAFNPAGLVEIGETAAGRPIVVNRFAYEADFHIIIGCVEPHEFAGFSGGRKSVLPGISSEACILRNHAFDMLASEAARPGSLEGNPIHQEMLEFAAAYGVDFSIQFLVGDQSEVLDCVTGSFPATHAEAVRRLCESIRVDVPDFDLLVTTPGVPQNIDFYQSVKPIIGLSSVLRANDKVILYAACPEGLNSPDMLAGFAAADTIEGVVAKLKQDYTIQKDHVLLLSRVFRKNCQIFAVTERVPDSELEQMFMCAAPNLQAAIDQACGQIRRQRRGPADGGPIRILFFPQAQRYLPG